MMTDTKLQAMLNYLTSLPQDKIQEVRIGWNAPNIDQPLEVVPTIAVVFKD